MIDLVFYLLVFLAVGTFFLFIHLLIGKMVRPNRPDPEKMTIYECGEPTVGSAWIQFDLRYYVVALLFVVFDVEVAFFFPWAVVFGKTNEMSKADESRRAELTKQLVPAELNLVYLERDRPKAPSIPDAPKGGPALPNEGKGVPPGGKGGPGGAKGGDKKGAGDAQSKKGKAKGDDDAKGAKKAPSGLPGIQPGDDRPGGPAIDAPQFEQPGGVAPPGGTPAPAPAKPKPPDVKTIDQQTARAWAWIAFGDIAVFFGVLMVGFAYLWKRGDIDWVRSTVAEQ